ncbi:MAG: hypothetical protein ACRCWI_01625 [Brevinema sp.]
MQKLLLLFSVFFLGIGLYASPMQKANKQLEILAHKFEKWDQMTKTVQSNKQSLSAEEVENIREDLSENFDLLSKLELNEKEQEQVNLLSGLLLFKYASLFMYLEEYFAAPK